MINTTKPIIITGSHRSGTTWVGNIIKNSPMIYYIHEPLTPNSITRGLFDTEIWYKYYDPNTKPLCYKFSQPASMLYNQG